MMNIRATMLYIALIAMIIIFANLGLLAPLSKWLHQLPYGDKIIHFIAFGGLALMVNISLKCAVWRVGQWSILKGSTLVLVLITLEEGSQYFLPSRTFSFADLFANYAGILAFSYLSLAFNCFNNATPQATPSQTD